METAGSRVEESLHFGRGWCQPEGSRLGTELSQFAASWEDCRAALDGQPLRLAQGRRGRLSLHNPSNFAVEMRRRSPYGTYICLLRARFLRI